MPVNTTLCGANKLPGAISIQNVESKASSTDNEEIYKIINHIINQLLYY